MALCDKNILIIAAVYYEKALKYVLSIKILKKSSYLR
jgi:hypothetical protein